MQNINCIIQWVKHAGGTFSGKKSFFCMSDTIIVGHKCPYEGRLPNNISISPTWFANDDMMLWATEPASLELALSSVNKQACLSVQHPSHILHHVVPPMIVQFLL